MNYQSLDEIIHKNLCELAENYGYSTSDICSFYEKDISEKKKDDYYSQSMVESYNKTMHVWRRVRYYMNRLDE